MSNMSSINNFSRCAPRAKRCISNINVVSKNKTQYYFVTPVIPQIWYSNQLAKNTSLLAIKQISGFKQFNYRNINLTHKSRQIVKVPPFADSISEGDVLFTCKVGDQVKEDENVMEIETDKTSVGVPAPISGTIEEIYVKDGDTVKPGQDLFKIKP